MIRKCCFCFENIAENNSRHIYFCKSCEENLSREEKRFKFLEYNFPIISSKEYLIENYINCLRSLPDLKSEHGIDFKSILFLLKYFSIQPRTASEGCKKIARPKTIKTNLERYGVTGTLARGTIFYEKRNQTVMQRYGVDNVRKAKVIIDKIKDDNHYIQKFGMTRRQFFSKKMKEVWENLTDERKTEIKKNRLEGIRNQTSIVGRKDCASSIEIKISQALNDLLISYEVQFSLENKLFDFKISKTNILIEVNGDYWHANPKIYLMEDVISYPGINKTAQEVWDKDIVKTEIAKKHGYIVIVFWENELNKKSREEIKNLVFERLENYGNSYDNQIN